MLASAHDTLPILNAAKLAENVHVLGWSSLMCPESVCLPCVRVGKLLLATFGD